ncbi:hypothetical protein M9Y10_028470 [Tritrichomonas musculus]|uniref:Transmembrane protein n=1 Tax=Tritrichomonas musculus TaxID=1915356 RepID=A0ABR2KJC6_9EUKA
MEEESTVEESIAEEEVSEHSFELPPMHHIKSNVFYYFVILLEHVWNFASAICLIIIQSFKLYYFPGPKSARNFSIVAPFLLFFINFIKLLCAKYGNRSENLIFTIASAALYIGSVFLNVYFIVWQIYIWYWELPIVMVSMILDFLLFVFTIILIIVFFSKK